MLSVKVSELSNRGQASFSLYHTNVSGALNFACFRTLDVCWKWKALIKFRWVSSISDNCFRESTPTSAASSSPACSTCSSSSDSVSSTSSSSSFSFACFFCPAFLVPMVLKMNSTPLRMSSLGPFALAAPEAMYLSNILQI